jgi:hypothetical protein
MIVAARAFTGGDVVIPSDEVRRRMNKMLNSEDTSKLQRWLARTWNAEASAIKYDEIALALEMGTPPNEWLTTWQQDYSKFVDEAWTPYSEKALADVSGYLSGYGVASDPRSSAINFWLDQEGGKLITRLTETQHRALNNIFTWAFNENLSPKDLEKYIRPVVGLNHVQEQAVRNYRAALIEKGVSPAQVEKLTSRYASRLHRSRAMTIARTEMGMAYNHGELMMMKEAVLTGGSLEGAIVTKTWMASGARICPACEDMHGETVDLDATFSCGVECPPLHPSCGCTLTYNAKIGR